MPQPGSRNDPYRGFNFKLELDGVTTAAFRECSGIDTSQNPIEYREGQDPLTVRKLVGLNTYSNIVLQRGITDAAGMELLEWREKAAAGRPERINGSIVLEDLDGNEVVRWNFVEGWPIKWSGPSLNATANEVTIESLEIAHEGLEKA